MKLSAHRTGGYHLCLSEDGVNFFPAAGTNVVNAFIPGGMYV